MRHRMRGRKLGRNASHRKAMFRNMASSLIKSVRVDEDDSQRAKIPGRIVTTLPKAKELRPFVEKLITLAKKAIAHQEKAEQFETSAERNSTEWKTWRESDQWNEWAQAIAPAVALRRRAFAALRDKEAVSVLFDELAEAFADRPGGYTRVIRIAKLRLGDSGQQAFIEFVGENDRVKAKSKIAPTVIEDEDRTPSAEETSDSTGEDKSTAEYSEPTETEVSNEETEPTSEESTEE